MVRLKKNLISCWNLGVVEGVAIMQTSSDGEDHTADQKTSQKMQFILECGGRCGPRMGKLIWTTPKSLPAAPTPPFATPLCFLYSRGGAIPNLTRDLEEDVMHRVTGSEAAAIMLTMPTMYTK